MMGDASWGRTIGPADNDSPASHAVRRSGVQAEVGVRCLELKATTEHRRGERLERQGLALVANVSVDRSASTTQAASRSRSRTMRSKKIAARVAGLVPGTQDQPA